MILLGFFRGFLDVLKDPKYRALTLWVILILLIGTVFYVQVEGWSWLDSFYFSVITLTTVGYGDLAPDKPIAKIFTIIYIFAGLSVLLSFIDAIADKRVSRLAERSRRRGGRTDSASDAEV